MEGLDNYKTGRKNNWRRTVWNEIARRVLSRWNAIVLYLAGEQDLDRPVALSKGFKANNMIAVDLRKEVVDKLRREGKLAIHGSLHAVVATLEADVILADMCCGLREPVISLMLTTLFYGRTKPGAVIVFNIQRGREINQTAEVLHLMQNKIKNFAIKVNLSPNIYKHRGLVLLSYMLDWARGSWREDLHDEEAIDISMNIFLKKLNPFFLSYKSDACNVFFDTLIVSNPFPSHPATRKELLSGYWKDEGKSYRYGVQPWEIKEILPKVQALKAIQTMRKNGTLEPCRNW